METGFAGSYSLTPPPPNTGVQTTGGSNDGTWGPLAESPTPPTANGNAAVLDFQNAMLSVSLTANSFSQRLGYLVFDAATSHLAFGLDVSYVITSGAVVPVPPAVPNLLNDQAVTFVTPTNPTIGDFQDFLVDLTSITLGVGQTITFFFDAVDVSPGATGGYIYLDNIAITAIPETGSTLALGCIVGASAFFRSRRRRG